MHHARATQWLQQEIAHGWASCPLTQNGCLRTPFLPTTTACWSPTNDTGTTCWVIGK